MEAYLKQFEEEENTNPSEETIRRWRNAIALVKNPRRRFRFVADLAKRSEAERTKLQIQGSDDYNPSDFEVENKNPLEEALRGWRNAVELFKNLCRRFPFIADLAKRSEAKKKPQIQGSEDSNLSGPLLPSISPQANTDFGELGNQTTVGSDDSNRSESLLPSVSSHANMNYGEQGNVANVVGSDDSNLSESLLPSGSPQANTDFGEPGNQTTIVDSDDSNRNDSLLPSVSSHANANNGEQGNVANVVGFDDSNLSESLLASVSPQANTDFGEPVNQTMTMGPSSSSFMINHPRHGTRGFDDSNLNESLSASVSPQANTDFGEPGNQTTTVGFDDSNLSELLLASVSPQANMDFGEPGNQTTTVGPSSSSFMIDIGDENDSNHPRHGTRVTILQWIFMLFALSLEMLSAYFDQLSSPNKSHYPLVSLLLAIAAVLTCILELIHNGIKEGVESTNSMVFGTLPDIFGLGLSVIQCLCSAEQYYFLHRHENNPMKLSLVPLFFFCCLVVLKFKMN